jgi:hypothetical protein
MRSALGRAKSRSWRKRTSRSPPPRWSRSSLESKSSCATYRRRPGRRSTNGCAPASPLPAGANASSLNRRAFSAALGNKCPYVSKVSAIVAWPIHDCTSFGEAPALTTKARTCTCVAQSRLHAHVGDKAAPCREWSRCRWMPARCSCAARSRRQLVHRPRYPFSRLMIDRYPLPVEADRAGESHRVHLPLPVPPLNGQPSPTTGRRAGVHERATR